MDEMTASEFLSQIGKEFIQYSEYFVQHKFLNVSSLRCIHIPDDINYIFGNVLSLGEKRQIENALMELKNVAVNEKETCSFEPESSAFSKISGKLEDRISLKKIELTEKERHLRQLEMPIEEPPPQGNLNYRCTNCHIRGHKADNNKGNNVCKNERCSTFLICGQKEKHKEFREERKSLQTQIRNIRLELESLTTEQNQFSEYKVRNDASFMKVMKDRLRKIDPLKYSKPSILMRHLMCLKSVYNGKIPPVTQNDRTELPKMIEKADEKKRELNSDSDVESYVPSLKRARSSVQSNQKFSQTYSSMPYQNQQFQQTVLQHHPTPYNTCNMMPSYPSVNYSLTQQPQPPYLFDQYSASMQPAYNPVYPNASLSPNSTVNFNQMPLQVIPQSQFCSYSTATDVYHSSTDEDNREDMSKPPKIWSPVGL